MSCIALRAACALMLLMSACASDPEPKPGPQMSIELLDPTSIGGGRYRLVAQISDFDPAANLHGDLVLSALGAQYSTKTYALDSITSPEIAIETDPLEAFALHHSTIHLQYEIPRQGLLSDLEDWTTGPPEITMGLPATVNDAQMVTITGNGLSVINSLQLGLRPSPGGEEVLRDLHALRCEPTRCTAQIPVVLSPYPDEAPVFSGAVPPTTVHIGRRNGPDKNADAIIGTTQLVYIMTVPAPKSGLAGSEFDVRLFHPARAPDLAGLTVFFGGMPIIPVKVTENIDIAAGTIIYLTVARFRVPPLTAPGTYPLRAVTRYGDELKTAGPGFIVLAP